MTDPCYGIHGGPFLHLGAPAKAGVQVSSFEAGLRKNWIPAFAEMTVEAKLLQFLIVQRT